MGKSRQSADLVSDNNIFIDIVNDRVGMGTTVPVGQFHVKTGPAIVGTSLSTGTASQNLQVTGGGYFSGSVGIGTTSPQEALHVVGVITATSYLGDGSQLTGIAATTNVRTDSLVVSGVSTTNNVIPDADATRNLGSSSRRWANIYSADLQLSNEGFSNDVDGTWGKYTIQEGENDLYLINRRTGKIYRFVLEEVN